MKTGTKIKICRQNQNMTQLQLCQGICTQGEISLIESNQRIPSVDLMTRLSNRLGIPLSTFQTSYMVSTEKLDNIKSSLDSLENLVALRKYGKMKLSLHLLKESCFDFSQELRQRFYCYEGIYYTYFEKAPVKAIESFRLGLQETNPTSFNNILDLPKRKERFSKIETLLLASAANNLSLIYKFDQSQFLFEIACSNVPKIDKQLSTHVLGTIFYNACKNFKIQRKYEKAIEIGNQGIKFEHSHNTIYRSAEILYEVANCYYLSSNFKIAEKNYIKSMWLSYSSGNIHFLDLLLPVLEQKKECSLLKKNIQILKLNY